MEVNGQLVQTMGALPKVSERQKEAGRKNIAKAREVRMAKRAEILGEGDFAVTPTHTKHLRKIAKEMGIELPTRSKERLTTALILQLRSYLMKHLEEGSLDSVLREFLSQRDK
jgi:hypothetical protein